MITRLVRAIAWLCGPPRVIYDGAGRRPYLSRYYLRGRPTRPCGGTPFDAWGNPHPDVAWPDGWGLYLHRFHTSDPNSGYLHDHPWSWAYALVLAGGYSEERLQPDGAVTRRACWPGTINRLRTGEFHRVDLYGEDSWSLFLAGPKGPSWGFYHRAARTFTPWRAHLARERAAAHDA